MFAAVHESVARMSASEGNADIAKSMSVPDL